MEFIESHIWYAIVVVGYFFVAVILLFLNRRGRDKKGSGIYRAVLKYIGYFAPPLDYPIEMDDLENDPGLVFALIVFGPLCIVLAVTLAIGAAACAFIFLGVIAFPRWIINKAVRK